MRNDLFGLREGIQMISRMTDLRAGKAVVVSAEWARTLEVALIESVKLQCHYAGLLNMWDAGTRRENFTAESWIARLKETGVLK